MELPLIPLKRLFILMFINGHRHKYFGNNYFPKVVVRYVVKMYAFVIVFVRSLVYIIENLCMRFIGGRSTRQ